MLVSQLLPSQIAAVDFLLAELALWYVHGRFFDQSVEIAENHNLDETRNLRKDRKKKRRAYFM